MAQRKGHSRAVPRQEIPRIRPAEAARILHDIEHLLDNSQALLADLGSVGIAELLRRLDDRMLQLAIQPDDSGERTRARLMSAIVPALLSETVPRVEDFVRITNLMLPCLLLELGRRKGNIDIDFPADPSAPDAQFRVSLGGPNSHILNAQQVVDLVATVGEELVGVCYFGDEPNRKRIEQSLSARLGRFPKHPA
jgi:hypothetical protein